MTALDFVEKIVRRYPALQKMEMVVSDIEQYCLSLHESDLEKLWTEFVNQYDRASPPMRANVVKFAQTLGLRQKAVFSSFVPVYKCDCGAVYEVTLYKCPKCDNRDRSKFSVEMIPADQVPKQKTQPELIGAEKVG